MQTKRQRMGYSHNSACYPGPWAVVNGQTQGVFFFGGGGGAGPGTKSKTRLIFSSLYEEVPGPHPLGLTCICPAPWWSPWFGRSVTTVYTDDPSSCTSASDVLPIFADVQPYFRGRSALFSRTFCPILDGRRDGLSLTARFHTHFSVLILRYKNQGVKFRCDHMWESNSIGTQHYWSGLKKLTAEYIVFT